MREFKEAKAPCSCSAVHGAWLVPQAAAAWLHQASMAAQWTDNSQGDVRFVRSGFIPLKKDLLKPLLQFLPGNRLVSQKGLQGKTDVEYDPDSSAEKRLAF